MYIVTLLFFKILKKIQIVFLFFLNFVGVILEGSNKSKMILSLKDDFLTSLDLFKLL